MLVAILIAVVLAAIVYWVCNAVGLPFPIPVIAALLVLLVAFPLGGRL